MSTPQPHLIPPMTHKGFAIGGMVSYDLPPCRYFPVKLFEQRNPRCAYCQTLVVITAAVRCPSCGAPR